MKKSLFFLLLALSGILISSRSQASQLKAVQTGTATIAAGAASTTATLTSVDTTKTFLVFGTSFDDGPPPNATPSCSHTSGQITNATTLTFAREGTTGCPAITVKWYVAEFLSGVSVQRGSVVNSTVASLNVALTAVNIARGFPIVSLRVTGSNFNCDDFIKAKITTTTNLQLSAGCTPGGVTQNIEWQVVEYTGATAHTGDVSFTAGQSSRTATISSVVTSQSWLFYNYNTVTQGTTLDIGQKLVRGAITNATTLTFDRNNTGEPLDLTWYLVEFGDGTKVQHNSQSFTSAETQKDVTINSVATSSSIATAGGSYMRGGRSPYSTDDNPGVGWFTLDLTSATNLRITRGATGSTTADVGWSVIQFSANPTAVRLSSFSATAHGDGVKLDWQTGYEADNLGFHVYREENGERIRLTPELVAGTALLAGSGTALTAGHSYSWWDAYSNSGEPSAISSRSSILHPQSSSVRYWLEDVDLNGTRTLHGPVTPVMSNQALPDNVSAELLSEVSRRVGDKYDDFWRAQDLKAKLWRKVSQGPALTAQTFDQSLSGIATAGVKPAAQVEEKPTRQDYARQKSLASRGAVKLLVKEKGWYRVSRKELMDGGLSSRANPRTLQLYRDGREQPIKVLSERNGRTETLVAVEFYGEGLDTVSTDTRTYWLIEGGRPGKRIKAGGTLSPQSSVLSAPKSFPFTVKKKDRVFYFAALKNGEEESFFGPLVTSEAVDQVLALSHIDPVPPSQALLEVALQGATNVAHRVKVMFNEVELGEVVFDGQSPALVEFFLPRSYLLEGDNVVTLVSQAGETDISLIDFIRLSYWHSYSADQDSLSFTAQGGQRLSVDGFSQPSIRVIDITDPQAHQEVAGEVQASGAGHGVTVEVPGKNERRLLAFTESEVRQPVSVLANRPSRWHQQARRADLLIVSHGDFLNELQPLKALRESQRLAVALIDVEDLYDEFSFGAKSAQAIKDLVALSKPNWRRRTGYVLLVGDASFDPKNYLGLGNNDFVPTKLIETGYLKTASDDWFVDFNNDGLPEAALGRLAVRTREEAAAVVAKIIGYEQQGRGAIANALLVADINDSFDFEQASEEIQTLLPASMRVERIYRGSFGSDQEAKNQLIESLNQGSLLVNYLGHGSVEILKGMLSSEDARSLTNSRLPFFIAMTCLNGFFHDVYTESLAEALLKAPRGGAVAVWASSTLSAPQGQTVMNQHLIHHLFSATSSTLGQAAMRAKASITDPDVRRSWMLFGDPSTRLR